MIKNLRQELRKAADPEKKKVLQNFFKTGPGQYGHGDIFLGVTVPKTRSIAKKYKDMDILQVTALLNSKMHEERLAAILILVHNYTTYSSDGAKQKIVFTYLANSKKINNWDLVDLSAPKILGKHMLHDKKKRDILYCLARSENLWERRISIISTMAFIKNNDFEDALRISEILLNDEHDLIHKAVGWMLREIGKKDITAEEKFLKKHYAKMPRTMLRYAIERFPERKRLSYLKKQQ